jgi:HlyD family secretion protein
MFKSGLCLVVIVSLWLTACGGGESPVDGPPVSTPIPTTAPQTYVVQRGDVQQTMTFSGHWLPRDQITLSFEISGSIRRILVRPGDAVTAGQLLADFQITDLENQLDSALLDLETAQTALLAGAQGGVQTVSDAEIALANARLSLESTRKGNPWPQVESARISLDAAELALESAQRAYDDAISRPDQPASVVEQAYDQLRNAENSLRSAQANYDSAAQSYITYQYQIAQAENAVIQAEQSLERARSGYIGDPSKEQAVRAAQLRVDQLNASIQQSSLYAPIDGQILNVFAKLGDQVQAYEAVIIIGLPEPKEVIANLPLPEAQKLSVGMVGVCQVMNRPDTAVQCAIRQVPLDAREADQTTRLAASLDDVMSGELIEVKMPLKVRVDVVWLPPYVLRTYQSRVFVTLQTPEGPRNVNVQTGLTTDDRIEITSGLAEGDVVILPLP